MNSSGVSSWLPNGLKKNSGPILPTSLSYSASSSSINQEGSKSSWFYQPLSTTSNGGPAGGNISHRSTASSSASWSSYVPFIGGNSSQSGSSSSYFSLSTSQRIICFVALLGCGLSCFIISSLYLPFLILKARKFCIFFIMGSFFVMTSFGFLFGPLNHLRHIFSLERIPFTTAYMGSLLATIFAAFQLQSTVLTILFSIIQIVSLIWYLISYLPAGHSGMKFMASMLTRSVSSTLPL